MPTEFGQFIAQKRKQKKSANERVHVYCRLRPHNEFDGETGGDGTGTPATVGDQTNKVNPIEDHDDTSVRVRDLDGKLKQFEYDQFFSSQATQDEVFETVAEPVIDAVVEGHNGTIFAYGQTGSGKTHTMLGPEGGSHESASLLDPASEGIIPRSLRKLFNEVAAQEETHDFKITVSYIQIYCEILSDLLQPSNTDSLVIRERRGTSNEVYISGASRFSVSSAEDCLRHIQAGSVNRATAFTQMNATSSRSHAVFILSMIKRPKVNAEAGDEVQKRMVRSQLFLVDLAGSERVANLGSAGFAGGDRFRELRAINLSLSALGNCIHALSKQSSSGAQSSNFVPYRDSKLTRLLQNSLGGNSKTSLVITIGPSPKNARETLSTLQFGTRAMAVQVTSVVNSEVDYKALYEKLLSEADKRDDRIHQLELSERDHKLARATAEKSRQKAEARAEKLELELEAQKTSLAKLEAAFKENFENSDEEDDDMAPVFITGDGIESPSRNRGNARLTLEMEQQLKEQIQEMSTKFENQVAKIRAQTQRQIQREASKSAKAVAEWHALELELSNTKEDMLETLRKQRQVQAELIELEQDSTERIADLTLKVQDLESELAEATEQEGPRELPEEQVDIIRERVEQRVLQNYVSQEKVVEMKQLYEDVVDKLAGRIDKLEVDVTKATSPKPKPKRGATTGRNSRYGSSHVSVVRSRAKKTDRNPPVKRTSYRLTTTRRTKSTTGVGAGGSSYRRGAASSNSKVSARSRAKEYAKKQRANKLMAEAARARNGRSSRRSSSSSYMSRTASSRLSSVKERRTSGLSKTTGFGGRSSRFGFR